MYFFCFKQKTAYEMRISDWSSDVCSSDLGDSFDVDRDHPAPVIVRHGRQVPPYRDARIVAQQVDRAVVAVYPIGDRRHLIWPGDVELDGRPVQFLGHRLSRLQFAVGNDDMHIGTRKGPRHAAPDATDRKSKHLNYSHYCAHRMPS